jgi:hypothetical protein
MSSLLRTNMQHQQGQHPQMSAAESMRQTTMTQAYDPGHRVAPVPAPLPAHISSVPPGYHYYELGGNCYFLNLASGEKVELGPVGPAPDKLVARHPASVVTPLDLDATSSFSTPSVKKRKARAIVTAEALAGSDEEEEVVFVRRRKKKTIGSLKPIVSSRDRVVTRRTSGDDEADEDDSRKVVDCDVECNSQQQEMSALTVLDTDSIDSSQLPKTGRFDKVGEESGCEQDSVTSEISDTVYDRQLEQSQQSVNLLDVQSSSDDEDVV